MWQKVIILLCSLALAKGGIIATDFSPATSVSYSSSSTPTISKTDTPKLSKVLKLPLDYTKIYAPSPLYDVTTQESELKTIDGTKRSIYSKRINTGYSDIKKVESHTIKDDDFIDSNIPTIYSTAIHQEPVFYHPQNAYSIPTPITHEISTPIVTKSTYIPINYDTHLNNLKTTSLDNIKALPSPSSKTSLLNSKSSTSNLSYYPHPSVRISEPIQTTVTFSDAPLVSHMTFKGLGASYEW